MTLTRPSQAGLRVVGRETTQLHPRDFTHQDTGDGGKESVNIYNLPGKGKCKAKIGPGRASGEERTGARRARAERSSDSKEKGPSSIGAYGLPQAERSVQAMT